MSDLQKSFAKAKLAKLPTEPPIPAMDPLEEDDSSGSSTGTVTPSPSKRLFARPDRECVFADLIVTPTKPLCNTIVAQPSTNEYHNTREYSGWMDHAANQSDTELHIQFSAGPSSLPRSSFCANSSTTLTSRTMCISRRRPREAPFSSCTTALARQGSPLRYVLKSSAKFFPTQVFSPLMHETMAKRPWLQMTVSLSPWT